MPRPYPNRAIAVFIASIFLLSGSISRAQTLSGQALITALRQGGNVIVMRHAASPRTLPDAATANPDNVNKERQLDAVGRETAKAMGKAVRDLKIPIGEVLTSPTYRARETGRLAELPNPKPVPELGDGGQGMAPATQESGTWLRKRVTQLPSGTNTVLLTHMPNLMSAFPAEATNVTDGECFIFATDGKGGAKLIARIKIEDWPKFAAAAAQGEKG